MQIAGTKQKGRRRFRWFAVPLDIEMHIQRADCDTDFTGKLVDVSYHVVGIRLACSQKIPANSDLQPRVVAGKNKEALTLGGMAVWCLRKEREAHSQNPIYHVGIELKAAITENQQKLEAEVADLLPEWVPHQYRALYRARSRNGHRIYRINRPVYHTLV